MAADDGFHEIQLNGKQLVFLFMATTVVAVVIFLGGVMVGRGVRMEKSAAAGTDAPATVAGLPQQGAEAPVASDLSYYGRLGKDSPVPETLSPPGDVPPAQAPAGDTAREVNPPAAGAATPAAADAPAARTTPEPPPVERAIQKPQVPAGVPAATPGAGAPPSSPGFVVQVAALEEKGEADKVLRRLEASGYRAFVLPPAGDMKFYRVRVGTFETRSEADAMARRLQKEGFKPWITR